MKMKHVLPLLIAVLMYAGLSSPLPARGRKSNPFAWPQLPPKSEIQKRMSLHTLNGLLILDRQCQLHIRSFYVPDQGIVREEFIRILVLNKEGASNAGIKVSDNADADVLSIEGRTILPDGKIIKINPKNDIQSVKVGGMKKKENVTALATVNFPSPKPGSILDLHFVTKTKGPPYFLLEPVIFNDLAEMKTTFDLDIQGGLPRTFWSVVLLNSNRASSSIRGVGRGKIHVDVGPILPKKTEPESPPYWRTKETLLTYINTADFKDRSAKAYSFKLSVDSQGRLKTFKWPEGPFTDYWTHFLKDNDKTNRQFIRHPGRADKFLPDGIAPVNLPLIQRLKRLYDFVQNQCRYTPGADHDPDTLSKMLRHGMTGSWQGTIFFSYLLDRAHIPHTDVLMVSRYGIQFSPGLTSSWIYRTRDAVTVEVPGRGRIFLTPGDLSLPFGCIQDTFQGSIAFALGAEDKIKMFDVPLDSMKDDTVQYTFDANLTQSGGLDGSLKMVETGAPAHYFWWWYSSWKYEISELKKKDNEKRESLQKKLRKNLKSELDLPGDLLNQSGWSVAKFSTHSEKPFLLKCSLSGKSVAQKVGGQWLVLVNPLLKGVTNEFTDLQRREPVWLDEGGRILMQGNIRLPAGAKVLDLPKSKNFTGPNGAKIHFEISKTMEKGAPVLHPVLEYDLPAVLGYEKYAALRAYIETLVKVSDLRCLIKMPGAKKLE